MEQYLKDKKENSIFAPLKNLSYFQNFTIGANTIEWANGADIAPERLYELEKQSLLEVRSNPQDKWGQTTLNSQP